MVFPDFPYNEACLKANLPKLSERRDMLSQNLFDNFTRNNNKCNREKISNIGMTRLKKSIQQASYGHCFSFVFASLPQGV